MMSSTGESFITEVALEEEDEKLVETIKNVPHSMSVLYEDMNEPSLPLVSIYTKQEESDHTDSEYDTDIENFEPQPVKVEYDSSGKDRYIKICKDLNMTPVSHFIRHIKDINLSLKNRRLGCKEVVAITQALMTNTHVENLDLSDNDVKSDGIISLSHMLTENYFITHITLDNNNVGLKGIVSLCDILSERSYVKSLSLAGNKLNDDSMYIISEMLKQNYALSRLNISHNNISCRGAVALSASLQNNYYISDLDLSWNTIRAKGGAALGKMLIGNGGLVKLNLSHNGFDLTGTKAIVKAIKTNETLVYLDLKNTRFASSETKELGKALALNASLKILKLGNNPLVKFDNSPESDLEILLHSLTASHSLFILGLEDISVSRSLYERFCKLEEETGLVIHYGHSGGYQRSSPMTRDTLILDEFITTNISKLAPLFLDKDKDKTGLITTSTFKNCLKEAGLELPENQLNWLIDRLVISEESFIAFNELVSGPLSVPATLESLRKKSAKGGRKWNVNLQP